MNKRLPFHFFCCLSLIFHSCGSPPTLISVEEWTNQFPTGLTAQLSAAEAAATAFHAISDTPMDELQSDAGAKLIGALVTDARDKYRHWQSYGEYSFPHMWTRVGVGQSTAGLVDWEIANSFCDEFHGEFSWNTLYCGVCFHQYHGVGQFATSRGRVVFSGPPHSPRSWKIHEPFKSILLGDRIADIPELVGKIRR